MFNQLFYKIPGKYSGTFWHYNRDAIYHEKKFLKSKFEAEAWQALQMLLTCWTSPVSLWIVKSQRLVCIYVCCCRCQNSQRNLQNCQKNYIIVEIVKIIINFSKNCAKSCKCHPWWWRRRWRSKTWPARLVKISMTIKISILRENTIECWLSFYLNFVDKVEK